ncbi:MAG: class I SAM-dependent methyltransferase [Novosphingobium sp.]|nr:class I SAM-dependent methyltransferase [Novosphingobium sp.]
MTTNDWDHGYYAGDGYTYGYHSHTMPIRLHWAAMVQGHSVPLHGFRYLDAGCGQGYNLVVAAIAHPDSQFVGVDFMPEHVAHGRALAKRLGLTNVEFVEADFAELANAPGKHGHFDYAVAHGITTWVDPAIRKALFAFVGGALIPGGLFYNSYNSLPGWLATIPFQNMVLLEQERNSPEEAISAARESFVRILDETKTLGEALPSMRPRLADISRRDPKYLVQEYNNKAWQPMFHSDMVRQVSSAKLTYLGTASLSEIFPSYIPDGVREFISSKSDPLVREQLIDCVTNKGFRRDLYVKGRNRPLIRELSAQRDAMRFIVNPLVPRPPKDEPFRITAGGVKLSAKSAAYAQVLDRIAASDEGASYLELYRAETNAKRRNALTEVLCLLTHGDWIMPVLPEPVSTNGEALKKLASAVASGAPYESLPVPKVGGAIRLHDTFWFAYDFMLRGGDAANISEMLLQTLRALNLQLNLKGKNLTDEAEIRAEIDARAEDFRTKILPRLRTWGLL